MTSAYPYASYYGPSAYVKKGEIPGNNYFHNPTRDYHGGRAAQHHAEMRQIALKVIQEVVPQMFRKVISTKIMDSIKKNLNNPNIRIK